MSGLNNSTQTTLAQKAGDTERQKIMAEYKKGGGEGGGDVTERAKKEAQGVIARALDALVAPISGLLPAKHLNAVLSLFNKWLIEDPAEKMVGRATELIDRHSWVKNELFLSFLEGVAAEIEDIGPTCKEPGARALVAKASDLLETIVPLIRNSGSASKMQPLAVGSKTLAELDGAKAKIVMDSNVLRSQVKSQADEDVVGKHIAGQISLISQLEDGLRNGPKKEPEPEELTVPFRERIAEAVQAVDKRIGDFNAALAPEVARLRSHTAQLKQKRGIAATQLTQTPFKKRTGNLIRQALGWLLWK